MHFCYCNGVANSAIKTLSEHTSTNEHKLWKLPLNDEKTYVHEFTFSCMEW